MKASNHMNYIALQQNIIGKPLRIGSGPDEGTETVPHLTKNGFNVFLNGTHSKPDFSPIIEHLHVGYMKHPHSMDGMPGCSGDLHYYLCITEHEYLVTISLKLDEETNGPSEEVTDWISLMKRKNFPEGIEDDSDNYYDIAEALLEAHLNDMFKFYESKEDINDWEFADDALKNMIMERYDSESKIS
jgi:hypothetical protein